MRDNGNNSVYEKVLSNQYDSNIEVLNIKVININLRPEDWLDVFCLLNPKDRHTQKR